MFITGMNPFLGSVFVFTTLLIAIPSAVKVFNYITTLWRGSIVFTPAMLFTIGLKLNLRDLFKVEVYGGALSHMVLWTGLVSVLVVGLGALTLPHFADIDYLVTPTLAAASVAAETDTHADIIIAGINCGRIRSQLGAVIAVMIATGKA